MIGTTNPLYEKVSNSMSFSKSLLSDDVEQQQSAEDKIETVLSLPHVPGTAAERPTSFLDGLRGLAALCVFNQHLMVDAEHYHGFGENGHYDFIGFPFIRLFYSGGAAAVTIFFVLSGFVLSQSSIALIQKGQKRKCRNGLIAALIRRPVRLYLPCFGVGLAVALLMQLPNNIYPDTIWQKAEPSLSAELHNLLNKCISFFNPFQRHAFNLRKFEYDVVVWTIPIELKGSVLIYALTGTLFFSSVPKIVLTGLLGCLSVVFLQCGWWEGGCFTAGLVLTIIDYYDLDTAYCFRYIRSPLRDLILHIMLLLGGYLLSQPVSEGHPEWSLDTPGWYYLTSWIPGTYDENNYYRFWTSYGATILIYATLRLRWSQALFNISPLQFLGRISFMLYLVHLPIFTCIENRLMRVFGQIQPSSEPQWWDNRLYIPDIGPKGLNSHWIIRWLTALTISVIVANFATRYLDQPSVRLSKRCGQLFSTYVIDRFG